MSARLSLGVIVLLIAVSTQACEASGQRVWEVNGVRLEEAQVERLASDIARQTVEAARRLEGLRLQDEQAARLEEIYRVVALDVYDSAVRVVGRSDLEDEAKERRIVDLVLSGQKRSTAEVEEVLDPEQYAIYRRWEEKQVEAFRQRGLWSQSRRRRGRGR